MPRYILVAGVDFGTSFTKVVLRDNNTPGQNAEVVTFPGHADGLLPSLVGIKHDCLVPPARLGDSAKLPYLKMLAAHVANGEALDQTPIQIPAALNALRRSRPDAEVVRDLLAFYFAHVMAATEDFIRTRSPWRNFEFPSAEEANAVLPTPPRRMNFLGRIWERLRTRSARLPPEQKGAALKPPDVPNDFLIYQLAVPTGLLSNNGATERLFRDAFVAGYDLRRSVCNHKKATVAAREWSEKVQAVLSGDPEDLENRFKWQCLLYPEAAAAVQTVFRSPNARDGLYMTMDVGAGTVDLNAFHRFTADGSHTRELKCCSAIVCPLGVQNLNDPHNAVEQRDETELMEELRNKLHCLYLQAQEYQPNLNLPPGMRPWDKATLYIFGGGAHHNGYRRTFMAGPRNCWIHQPQVFNLPSPQDLNRPGNVEFGRFAVAYGLSFHRHNLDHVRLPHQLTPFRELYTEPENEPPRQYGFNWDD